MLCISRLCCKDSLNSTIQVGLYVKNKHKPFFSATEFMDGLIKFKHYLNIRLRYSYLQQNKIGVFSYAFQMYTSIKRITIG